jgi:pimeloyl-ACP methyl ester carboxylesterase
MKVLLAYNFFIWFFLLCPAISHTQPGAVGEDRFITIGGIQQWITITGDDLTKPVILFLHGGPGSVMSHYKDEIFKEWKKDFTIVLWDQRGAGRTFGKNAPGNVDEDYWIENPLTIDRMTADGIELTEYLLKRLKKDKIILMGTSWGSVLGAKMALKNPDLFLAYLGHSQVVNGFDSEIYNKVFQLAENANDKTSLEKLKSIGVPPYDDAKNAGQFLRIVKKFEKENSISAPAIWWNIKPAYDNEVDNKHREDGDDYSFINYVGHKKLGIKSMMSEVNFMNDGLLFKVPVYFFQGENDILTPPQTTKEYFDKITAPQKEFYLIPGAAHGYNQAVVDAQYKIVKKLVAKKDK